MKLLLSFLIQCFFLMPLAADIPSSLAAPSTELTVIPRDVFIGDEMEIHYAFQSDEMLLPSGTDLLPLSVQDTDDVSVLEMQLYRELDCYVITARCIGWRTGQVKLPDVDIQQSNPLLEEPYVVHIPPVSILSVVDYTGKKELRPARAPLVIPGTTWIIYVLIIISVLVFAAIIVILIRFRAFKTRFYAVFASVLIARNYRLLRRRIKRFLKRFLEAETAVFATELAHFIRGYMSVRFKTDFDAVTASEFVSSFAEAMNYTGSPESVGATEVIADILRRCDYVRFSGDTGDAGDLTGDERSSMCSEFLTAVACYDRESCE